MVGHPGWPLAQRPVPAPRVQSEGQPHHQTPVSLARPNAVWIVIRLSLSEVESDLGGRPSLQLVRQPRQQLYLQEQLERVVQAPPPVFAGSVGRGHVEHRLRIAELHGALEVREGVCVVRCATSSRPSCARRSSTRFGAPALIARRAVGGARAWAPSDRAGTRPAGSARTLRSWRSGSLTGTVGSASLVHDDAGPPER